MSPTPPNDDHAAHRDRLERVLVSDLRPDSAEVLAWRAACGACARELDGLLRLGRTLDRAGREEQEDVRVATAENATAPVNEAVRARLLALAAAPAAAPAPAEAPSDERAAPEAPSPARPRRALVAAAAAAAVVALALAIRSFRADEGASELPADGPSGVRLGHGFEMAPEGVVREPFPFTWQVERPGGGAYVLRVFDPQGREVLPAVRLEEPRWVPDPSTRSALPPEFTWEVTVLSATGDPVAVDRRDVVVRP